MRLFCDAQECVHRDAITGVCGYDGDMSTWSFYELDTEDLPCFESVLNLPEYQVSFWTANRLTKTGLEYREKKRGKCCAVNGIVFFVRDPLPPPELWPEAKEIQCTEVNTGMAFPLHRLYDEAGVAAIRRVIETRPPVKELPTYDEVKEALSIDE